MHVKMAIVILMVAGTVKVFAGGGVVGSNVRCRRAMEGGGIIHDSTT